MEASIVGACTHAHGTLINAFGKFMAPSLLLLFLPTALTIFPFSFKKPLKVKMVRAPSLIRKPFCKQKRNGLMMHAKAQPSSAAKMPAGRKLFNSVSCNLEAKILILIRAELKHVYS